MDWKKTSATLCLKAVIARAGLLAQDGIFHNDMHLMNIRLWILYTVPQNRAQSKGLSPHSGQSTNCVHASDTFSCSLLAPPHFPCELHHRVKGSPPGHHCRYTQASAHICCTSHSSPPPFISEPVQKRRSRPSSDHSRCASPTKQKTKRTKGIKSLSGVLQAVWGWGNYELVLSFCMRGCLGAEARWGWLV
jgi:hypothetical protein